MVSKSFHPVLIGLITLSTPLLADAGKETTGQTSVVQAQNEQNILSQASSTQGVQKICAPPSGANCGPAEVSEEIVQKRVVPDEEKSAQEVMENGQQQTSVNAQNQANVGWQASSTICIPDLDGQVAAGC